MPNLLSAATATVTGQSVEINKDLISVIGYGTTSSGAGSATISLEVSHDGTGWVSAGTLTLTLATTITTDTNTAGFNVYSAARYIRANVTAISGTGAAVTVGV